MCIVIFLLHSGIHGAHWCLRLSRFHSYTVCNGSIDWCVQEESYICNRHSCSYHE
uniref:SRCR domain-containing protein n=1 Tax=Anguilla anguilla TaxID=7936 RepID=A0A0E9TB42_ANGAN